ncbi:MFS transporter [Xanthomonas rydalmerensis]|uniref:MFS transporter n=1 Tax=Xanthomonas rydalmerensis TaxID=3046274 RepID=A0ABZ0JKB1_9XANT|nr:MFS transporter [Xanthomonas sp. DM-2023]WOS39652.1 MFS transporter [Xanthomonas sp. DM-2023]WOS43836.1 MFS transporter [Xanthomonas sp. DM-2023]WOS48016.1 MFS transporter [Xanthomonas sp. DM-2023]WOS52195.1 MFS transporter [Xanthomonas sp. DM-2023]WOS56379.1 MFS transporter [Xanthomonas sp. DM-2023]
MSGQGLECGAPSRPPEARRLPWSGLLALACAGFVTILTETLPAGLLPAMADRLGVGEAWIGQLVSVYALGSLLAAIPLTAATRRQRRRRLLLLAIAGFAVANTVTAVSSRYAPILVARLLAGVSAGLLWALLAGYASRMVAPAQQGRAIAVAMVGTPLALALGVPAGTWLGQQVGWRWSFGAMSLLSLGLLGWARAALPDFAGQAAHAALPLRRVLRLPGIARVLAVMLLFVLAHNLLYTYVAPLLARSGAAVAVDRALLLFGVAALLGIVVVGTWIDRWLRPLLLASIALFALAALTLALWPRSPTLLAVALALWGLAFGGCATLFQTAIARRAGDAADLAQSLVVTGWNLAIASAGLLGGALLQRHGAAALPWTALGLLLPAWACAHRH